MAGRDNTYSANRRRGLTLFEILAAVAIFSLMSVLIFNVFHAAVRSMERYDRATLAMQSSRVTMDLLQQDLRSVIYERQSVLNRNFFRREFTLRRQIIMERERQIQEFGEAQPIDPMSPDFKDRFGELNKQGLPIDMEFQGTDGGQTDKLSFVRYYAGGWEPLPGVGSFSHLSRIEYYVEDGNLFRSEGTIQVPEFDLYGQTMDAPDPPKELIAENVEVFDLYYGYWKAGEWFIQPEWRSDQSEHRNPYKEFDYLRGEPVLETFFQNMGSYPYDGMPLFIQLTLALRDTTVKEGVQGKLRKFESQITIPTSIEVWRGLTLKERVDLEDLGVEVPYE